MTTDELLMPEDDSVKPTQKTNSTKSRLDGLKQMLMADSVNIDTSSMTANLGDFPVSQQAKYVDYDEHKRNHKEFATQAITNIIETYVKSEKLLESPRLKDHKQKDILRYSQLLFLLQISEANLIMLQESIDGGDMSKEMFDSVRLEQNTMRQNMEALDKHLNSCEEYWKDYADNFGLESEEEKIVHEADNKEDKKKHTIISLSDLSERVNQMMDEKKKSDTKKGDQ